MTHQTKAIELMKIFDNNKKYALLCCDQMIDQAMDIHSEYPELPPDNEIRFLEKVKQYIKNM